MSQPLESKLVNLENYKWQNRLILLFSPDADRADFKSQLEVLMTYRAGVEDRDLKILQLFKGSGLVDKDELSEVDIRSLRVQFGVTPQSFTLILIGKDGSVKRCSAEVVSAADFSPKLTVCLCANVKCAQTISHLALN